MGAATVAAIGASITGAEAHIPGVGNGLPPTTNAPDLRSVKVVRVTAATDRALYCFDQNVSNLGPASAYGIQGYDAAKSFTASGVTRSTESDSCVLATFPDGSELSQGTTGVVRPGASSNTATIPNGFASEPLEGSAVVPAPGATTGPDLVSAVPDTSGSPYSVLYTYDEPINGAPAAAYNAANFAVFDATGGKNPGMKVLATSGNSIRIDFGTFNTQNGNQVYTSDFGAVEDVPMTVGGATGSSQGIVGTTAARPGIEAAVPSGASTFKVTFSETVNSPLTARFFAVTDVGTGFAATSVSSNGDKSVNVTFAAEVARDADNVVRIFAQPGAVQSASSTPSIISQAATSTPNSRPGFTNGPDLLGVGIDGSSRTVTYKFDEPVNADSGSQPAPTAFRGVAADGSAQSGSSNVAADGNNYNVIFPTTLSAAVAFEVDAKVLQDRTGRPNPIGSVSIVNEQAPPPPATTPSVPTTPPPPVKTRAKFRTTFSSFKVRSRTRYSGRIRSSGRGCKSGRRIALKRNGRTIRSGFTRGDGTFTLARSKGTRGKKGVYAVVTQRVTSTTICTARGSKKLKRG